MGLLDRLRAVKVPVQPARAAAPTLELPADLITDARACVQTGKDVGTVTRGKGSAQQMTVAGTAYRLDALRWAAGQHPADGKQTMAGVVVREPTNPHDPNAIRVLVDGVHIGFLPAHQAKLWQPTLLECEQRGLTLVGSVRVVQRDGAETPAAVIALRDGLQGFPGPVSQLRAEEYAKGKAAAAETERARREAAVLLTGDSLTDVVTRLRRLERQDPVRTKQKAGLVARQVREMMPVLVGHADALELAEPDTDHDFVDAVEFLNDAVTEMLDATDPDDREDAHLDLQGLLEDMLTALDPAGTT